jgi:hypothetical protein
MMKVFPKMIASTARVDAVGKNCRSYVSCECLPADVTAKASLAMQSSIGRECSRGILARGRASSAHRFITLKSLCMYAHVGTPSTVPRRVVTENNFQHQQRCSHYDRAVRQVEHWPLILLHIQEHKIHDAPAGHAVP